MNGIEYGMLISTWCFFIVPHMKQVDEQRFMGRGTGYHHCWRVPAYLVNRR